MHRIATPAEPPALRQVFYLQKPIAAAVDVSIEGSLAMMRQPRNPRLYNVKVRRSQLKRGCRMAACVCFNPIYHMVILLKHAQIVKSMLIMLKHAQIVKACSDC